MHVQKTQAATYSQHDNKKVKNLQAGSQDVKFT